MVMRRPGAHNTVVHGQGALALFSVHFTCRALHHKGCKTAPCFFPQDLDNAMDIVKQALNDVGIKATTQQILGSLCMEAPKDMQALDIMATAMAYFKVC